MPISDVLDRFHVTGSALGPANRPPEWLRVSDYGAIEDGVTNDSGAILATIAAVVAQGGGTVLLGPHTYYLGTTTLVIPDTVNLIGVGYGTTITYAGTGSAIRLSGAQFATVGHFIVRTTLDAGTAIEAGTATRQSLLTHIAAVGPTTLTNTGSGFYLNAISGFSGGLTIYNCNVTGYKFGVKFTSVNLSTDTWTAVDITSLWAVGRGAGVVAGSCGISFDALTNGIGTIWRGGTIEFFATGIKHVTGGAGGTIECDLESNTTDVSVGASFTGRITIPGGGVLTSYSDLVSKTSLSSGTTPATVGAIRLATAGAINWRNSTDSANIPGLSVDDTHVYLGQNGLAIVSGSVDNTQDLGMAALRWRAAYVAQGLVLGTTPALTGLVRLPNGTAGQIIARNFLDNADISLLQLYTDNQIYMGVTGVSVSPNNDNAQNLGQAAQRWGSLYVGTSVIAGGANGQLFSGFQQLTELTTVAAAATTDTTIQMPANSVVLAVSVRVTVIIPTAATFTVGDSGSAARFSTAAVAVAAGSTDPGTKAGAYYNASALSIRLTPNIQPAANTGRVRVTIYYYTVTPPTS